MLFLNPNNISFITAYSDKVKAKTLSNLQKSRLDKTAKLFLTDKKIIEILKAKPDKLLKHHFDLVKTIVPGVTRKEYTNYVLTTYKKIKTKADKQLIKKYSKTEEIKKVFNYEKIISGNKTFSYWLAEMLNRNTCTYCNRIYTTTTQSKTIKGKPVLISRPQFDHWFSKSHYPTLALSLHNLIPSCNICNSSIKGSLPFDLFSHAHPYIDDILNDFKFSFSNRTITTYRVRIDKPKNPKTEKLLEAFKIRDVYDSHSHLELKDLIHLRLKYSENYLNTLFKDTFKDISISSSDIYRLIFGIEINAKDYHKRPFSKFKHDIIKELRKI